VTYADTRVDYVSAPKDYDQLHRMYYDYAVALCKRSGIEESRAEDVASDILLRFFERDFLNKFDPSLVFYYRGQERPARFKSFLTQFVLTYVRGHRDRLQRQTTREVLICDRPIGQSVDLLSWVEVYGPTVDGPEEAYADTAVEAALVARLRAHIETVPRRSPQDTCNLVALFDTVIAQIRTSGHWNITELGRLFGGASTTTLYGWMWWLRANLADALGRPVPAKRPRLVRSA
jgi:DNA-directed RNA polymerase specialized sigma24 family protein